MKQNLFKTMLLAVALFGATGGVKMLAYDLPENYEIKKVYLGSLATDGKSVIPEDFESVDALDANWNVNTVNSIGLASVTEIAKPEIGSSVESVVPTYVSGNTFQAYLRKGSGANYFASYNFDAISTGKLIFSGDIYASSNITGTVILRFLNSKGDNVLTLQYNNGSGARYYQYIVGDGTAQNTKAASIYRTYPGYGIKDLIFDFTTGEVQFTLDYINSKGVRTQTICDGINIGLNNDIAQLQIGKPSVSSTNLYFNIDNVELYNVGTASGTYNYNVIARAGEDNIKTLSTNTCKGGSSFSVEGLPYIIEKDGKYYVINDAEVENYKKSFIMGNSDEDKYIDYLYDSSVVFFIDGDGSDWPQYDNSASGGVIGCWGNKKNVASINLEKGKYDIEFNVWSKGGRGKNFRGFVIDYGEEKILDSENKTGKHSHTISLLDKSNVYLYGNGTNKATDNIDYVVVRKLSDLAPISSAAFATYSPSSNVIVPAEESGIKVYTAKVEGNQINLTQVEAGKVLKAGTGYVVAGEENSYEFALTNEAAEAIEGNELKVATGEGLTATADTKYYVLTKRADGVGFGKVATDVNIPAGKCYIDLSATASKATFLSFSGETTGISNMEAAKANTNEYFSLQGVKTMKPNKGIYIHNGKKVVIK